MIYLLPTGSDNMRGMPSSRFGVMRAPQGGNAWGIKNGYRWAADNGAFTNGFNPKLFFDWLITMLPWLATCLFVAIPDVVGNALATMSLYKYWAWRVKVMGYPVAFVAQDGQEDFPFPPEFDWLFIGGSTEWKMGDGAAECILRAKRLGKPVHIGRVNSLKRVKYFRVLGADSVDGTHWIYEPDRAREHMQGWMSHIPLFTLGE